MAALPPSQVAELSHHGSQMGRLLTQTFALTGETGSYRYMAPEVFRHEAYNQKVLLMLIPLPPGKRPQLWFAQSFQPARVGQRGQHTSF